jgi:hypothetical protein
MKFLKVNKQSSAIVTKQSGVVTIVNVKKDKYKEVEVSHLDLLTPEGETVSKTVAGHNYVVGPATVLEIQWSAESKYGAGVSTKITNIVKHDLIIEGD